MKSTQYPLQVPDDLMDEIESTAKTIRLSKADVMRQSMKLGLPKLRERLWVTSGRVTNIDPLPPGILSKLYREREDEEDSIRQFIAAQPKNAE
jgi:hypothetical protein